MSSWPRYPRTAFASPSPTHPAANCRYGTDRLGTTVLFDLDELITITEPTDLGACTLADLRVIRDHYQDLENGLSYARRMVQGRLDTVTVELDRRRDGVDSDDLMQRLPEALAAHTRGPGLPRPVRDLDPPDWADGIVLELDQILTPVDLGNIGGLSEDQLQFAALKIADLEGELSASRHEMHRRIDRVQDELVGRYRSGATVDDLLR